MEHSSASEKVLISLAKELNLNFSLNKRDFTCSMKERNLPNTVLDNIRLKLFKTVQSAGLAERNADIVCRRGTSLDPLSQKLSKDIWDLAKCIASSQPVKHTMYRGGKKCAAYLTHLWDGNENKDKDLSHEEVVNVLPQVENEHTAFVSTSDSHTSSGHMSVEQINGISVNDASESDPDTNLYPSQSVTKGDVITGNCPFSTIEYLKIQIENLQSSLYKMQRDLEQVKSSTHKPIHHCHLYVSFKWKLDTGCDVRKVLQLLSCITSSFSS